MSPTPVRKPPRRAPASARASRPAALPRWAVGCFFGSGAAGLLYEVVWSKQLSYMLGNSLHAVATVVAAFLAGLAIGALLLGTRLARRGHGARTYAGLELGVALLGVAMLPLLRGMEPMVGALYRGLGGEGTSFALARFGLLFTVLLPPAALMGATLPVLVAHVERDRVGAGLARLYALNTLGAVAGSLAGGFLLLPAIGLLGTSMVAAAVNAAVALMAWRVARNDAARDAAAAARAPAADAEAPPVAGALEGAPRVVFALLFAASGFAALAFQIAWVRLFGLMFGSSVYSFSAVLGVYLLGLALGSAAIARLVGRGVSLLHFGRLQLALALCAAIMTGAFSRLPDWMLSAARASGARWGTLFASEVMVTAALLLVPCALLGAVFPVAVRLLQRREAGQATGFGYAVNTAGTIAGSLAAGFVMIPALGVQGTHIAALSLSAAIGLAAFALARRELKRFDLPIALTTAALIAAVVWVAPRWNPSLMSSGPYRPNQAANLERAASNAPGAGGVAERASRTERVLYYREGVNGTVLVGTDDEGKGRWLKVGGKIDASLADMETQVLCGLLPAVIADSGARTMVIGLGSGYTAAAALAGGTGVTDVIEIEQCVVEASHFFHDAAQDPLHDPRVRLTIGDARTQLAHGRDTYQLIISEPTNPWISGVNSLFTEDFYRQVRARLAPDGVFCQWMQLYELSPETFSSMMATFLRVFPEGTVFAVWKNVDLLLVACPPGRTLDRTRLETAEARRLLEVARIRDPEAVAAYYAAPLSGLVPLTARAPLNTDDRPIVEYRAPRDLVTVGATMESVNQQVVMKIPFAERMPEGALYADWAPESWYGARARQLMEQGDAVHASIAIQGTRKAGFEPLANQLSADYEQATRRAQGLAAVQRATELMVAGRRDEGREQLKRATEIDPLNARAWVMYADQLRLAGDRAGCEAALARGVAIGDAEVRSEAEVVRGMLDIGRQKPLDAAAHFREAQRLNPGYARAYVLEALSRRDGGDFAGARDAVSRGLLAVPGDPQLTETQATLAATR